MTAPTPAAVAPLILQTQLYDGTHPTPKGIDLLLKCMAPTVRALVGKGRSGQPLVG